MFKQSTQHVRSYYAATHPEPLQLRATLNESIDTDVLIIGGGFSGLHCALRLLQAGKRVVVLEASRLAWAASGRNGGQALLGWSCDMPPFETTLGLSGAQRLWGSMQWAADEMRALPQRHGFDIDYRPGSLYTAVLAKRVAQLHAAEREAHEKWSSPGVRFIAGEELREWIGSERYLAALYDPQGAHINPLKLAQGLAAAIEQLGGQIFEQSQVLDYRQAGEGYLARTNNAEVRADVLILACNAYIDQLDRPLSRRILPVGSYQVATAPLSAELAQSLLPKNSCVIDNQFVPDYFRLTPDNRLLFGGGCTYLGGIPKDVAAATRPYLQRVFPQLAGVKLDYAWGGHIDCTLKRTPDIGCEGRRYWLQGFSGHGVLPTLAGARAVTDAILGDTELLELYQGLHNPAFPGGSTFAAPIEALGKAWYRLRDVV
ncbi:NAD(P)/FAD-dependent oxidoreductase [Pseudomonas sp. NPDC078700]|uniref:NAD(P)/FAD-dependent oxidoreductase n=1 Tax=Pseudomonas sp. NPDC078700 TaxID=3364424 RepID=UPI0037CA94AD